MPRNQETDPADSLASFSRVRVHGTQRAGQGDCKGHSRVQPVVLALLLSSDPHKVASCTWNSEPAVS